MEDDDMNISLSLIKEFEDIYNDYIGTKMRLLEIEGIAPHQLDVGDISKKYFTEKLADISTDSNSNFVENMSPSSYRTTLTGGIMKLLGYHMLWYHSKERYGSDFAEEAIRMIWDGDLYFHDAHGVRIQMPYCYAFSIASMIFEGRPYGSSPNTAPKNRKSFLSQLDKLISDMSKQFAGATAPSDFFLWYAYFCKQDKFDVTMVSNKHPWYNDSYKEIVNDFQGLVCLFNEPSRAEGEPPFTNIALYDSEGLKNLFGHIVYPDGTKPDLNFIMKLQRMFAEWFSKGDPITGFPYRFPVVTMNLTTDKYGTFLDDNTAQWFADVNCNMGNFNIHFGEKAKLAMCCRYENDLDDMDMTPDSFGNGGVNIGSHRVITINIPRAAIIADGDIGTFNSILDNYMDVASKLLMVHRYEILQARIEKSPDYLQFFGKLGWFNLKTMFSTFGITGMNEACEYMGLDLLDEDGTDFMLDTLDHIRGNIKKFRKQYSIPFNTEEIPGEQACVSMVDKDKAMFQIDDYPLYSNQYIPLIKPADIYTRLDLSGRFMKQISGGGIVHINHETKIDSQEKMYALMKLAAHSGVPHLAVCYRFGKCVNGHTHIIGQATECPECGEPIERARNRVIGYYSDEICWSPVRRKVDAPFRHFSNYESGDE